MRNKEPLMGLMLMQGHFVMHFSMFLGSFFVNTDYSKVKKYIDDEVKELEGTGAYAMDPDKYKKVDQYVWEIMKFNRLYDSFIWIKYTHLLVGLMIVYYQYAKLSDKIALSGTLGLFIPIIYFIIITWKTNIKLESAFSNNNDSTADLSVIQWMELESEVFIF